MHTTAKIIEHAKTLYCDLFARAQQLQHAETDVARGYYRPITDLHDQVQACCEKVGDRGYQEHFAALYEMRVRPLLVHQAMSHALQMIYHVQLATLPQRPNDMLWDNIHRLVGPAFAVVDQFLYLERTHRFQHGLIQAVDVANRLAEGRTSWCGMPSHLERTTR